MPLVEMEPDFTKAVSNRFICDYLYFYFMWAIVLGVLSIIAGGTLAFNMKGTVLIKMAVFLPYVFVAGLASLLGLSLYLMCERGLAVMDKEKK
jgi:hypothetical protein